MNPVENLITDLIEKLSENKSKVWGFFFMFLPEILYISSVLPFYCLNERCVQQGLTCGTVGQSVTHDVTITMPIQILTAPCPIQLPPNAHRKMMQHGPLHPCGDLGRILGS